MCEVIGCGVTEICSFHAYSYRKFCLAWAFVFLKVRPVRFEQGFDFILWRHLVVVKYPVGNTQIFGLFYAFVRQSAVGGLIIVFIFKALPGKVFFDRFFTILFVSIASDYGFAVFQLVGNAVFVAGISIEKVKFYKFFAFRGVFAEI